MLLDRLWSIELGIIQKWATISKALFMTTFEQMPVKFLLVEILHMHAQLNPFRRWE
jgi:hypothetical protein